MRILTGQLGRRGALRCSAWGYLWWCWRWPTLAAAFCRVAGAGRGGTRLVRPTTQIFDRHGRLLYETIDPNAGKQINLDLTQIPQACVNAVVATEDARFFYHPGVDPIAVARAAWQYVAAGGEIVSGASTITQQLARNILMGPEERYDQSPARKLREQWLALRLERRYTKDEILALYLNQTYFGNWAFGLEAAAQVFFAKPARQLSTAECALLAGLIQHPTGYNPLLYPETAKARQLTVLRLMREARYLDDAAAAQVAAEPLQYRSNLFAIKAPHFVMYVQDLLADQLGVDRLRAGGLRVYTTLDLGYRRGGGAVRRRLDQLNCRVPGACDDSVDPNRRVDNAAAVVLDSHTGDILAMVGSPDYFDATIQGNVNAALSLRQPGSAIKPLTYAAALDPDWSAARPDAADRSHGHRRSAHHLLRQRRGRRQRALRRSTTTAPTTGRSVCARRWPTATTSPRSRCSTASAWRPCSRLPGRRASAPSAATSASR
ncbi:MAG: transglycosylase domain-containing protein [Caldilineaceae bacterium]